MKNVTKAALLVVLLSAGGCTTVQVKETAQIAAPTGTARIAAGEAVAILTYAASETDLEADAVECIRDQVASVHPAVGIIKADEFRRTVFPYRIPDDAAERERYLDLLMGQPALRQRMTELKLRYLVLLQGQTEMKPTSGFGAAGSGPTGGGYVVFGSWDRKTALVVSIVDVTELRTITKLEAEATGTPWVFSANIIFTIGAPAFTEGQACKGIGQAVTKFLAGQTIEQIKSADETQDKEN